MMSRIQGTFGRFVVLVGAVMLMLTVGCEAETTSPSPSSSKTQTPAPPTPPAPLESPTPILRDLAKTPSWPSGNNRAEDIPRVEAHSGNIAKRQSNGASKPGPVSAGRGGALVVPPSDTSRAGTRPQLSAKLSAGVALPQSLPTGTTMGFSVDYVFLGSSPTSSGQIVWVIESAKHGSAEVVIRLDSQGNLMTFVPGMRPEHGPFQSYLAIAFSDGRKQPISAKVAMKSP